MSVPTPLALLAARVQESAGEATRASWRLLDLPPAWVVVLLLLPAAGTVAWLAYRAERLSRGKRLLLGGLRFLSLCLLMVVLARPVLVQHQESVRPAEVLVLLDDSASMSRVDDYLGDTDARQALREVTGLDVAQSERGALARAGVEKALLPVLEERGYEVRGFRFSDSLSPVGDYGEATFRGSATHVGDALLEVLAAAGGRHVTDVVLVGDGRSNGGTPAEDAAQNARTSGIPVHTVVVGDARREKNLAVELIDVPDSVLEGDEIAIGVRVTARGTEGVGLNQVLLEELGDERRGDQPRLVAEAQTEPSEAGTRVVLVAPPGTPAPGQQERRFRISVPPLEGETEAGDNSLEVTVHVATEKVRVLYVDGYPRWEYRFLKDLLKRSDERIEVQCWLMSATPGFPQESTRGTPPLTDVPTGRKELLDDYDVIILGDVNPYDISPDPARGEEFVASLFEFVERGGGLCVIAGEWKMPATVAGTELAKLLPVRLDTSGTLTLEWDTRREFRPSLEEPANPHEIVRLHQDVDINRRLWEESAGLRGFYWFHPVTGAKPGAQVLLRHPSLTGPQGRFPLLVVGHYPAGRTMFLAVDSTYRWQYRYKKLYHERFWRNAVRWLALGRLRGGDRRYSLEPLRTVYDLDERITFEARVLDEDYRPSEAERHEARLRGPSGDTQGLGLDLVDGRPGLYRGSFETDRPGVYRAWIEVSGDRVATGEVEVVLPSRESSDPSPDPEAMRTVALLSEGMAVDLGSLEDLLDEFPGGEERREPISSELLDVWDDWATLIAALALLSAEWILRKRHELV